MQTTTTNSEMQLAGGGKTSETHQVKRYTGPIHADELGTGGVPTPREDWSNGFIWKQEHLHNFEFKFPLPLEFPHLHLFLFPSLNYLPVSGPAVPCSVALPNLSLTSTVLLIRTHHTTTHLHRVDSLGCRCRLLTCSHKCGCHMGSSLDRKESE